MQFIPIDIHKDSPHELHPPTSLVADLWTDIAASSTGSAGIVHSTISGEA